MSESPLLPLCNEPPVKKASLEAEAHQSFTPFDRASVTQN